MIRLPLFLVLLLAGCQATMPKTVEIPVAVPCDVLLPAKPVWATESLRPDAGIFEQVKALLAERRQREGYEVLLEAAATSCSSRGPTPSR